MLGPERLLEDRQRALVERPRAGEIALDLQQGREVVEARRGRGMLGPCSRPARSAMTNGSEKRLIEALKNVDVHGDVAAPDVYDPMTMLLQENAIQANLMRWNDARGRYALTGAGRRRISERGRAPGTILSFRKRDAMRSGVSRRKPASADPKE
jgi:hypothetical protein